MWRSLCVGRRSLSTSKTNCLQLNRLETLSQSPIDYLRWLWEESHGHAVKEVENRACIPWIMALTGRQHTPAVAYLRVTAPRSLHAHMQQWHRKGDHLVGLDFICIWWLSVCHDGPIPRDNIWGLWARWNTTLVPPIDNRHLRLIPALLTYSLSLPHAFLKPSKPTYITIHNTTRKIIFSRYPKA